jgi:hypothetical protein
MKLKKLKLSEAYPARMPHTNKSKKSGKTYNDNIQECPCGYKIGYSNNVKAVKISLQMKLHMKKCPINWENKKYEIAVFDTKSIQQDGNHISQRMERFRM